MALLLSACAGPKAQQAPAAHPAEQAKATAAAPPNSTASASEAGTAAAAATAAASADAKADAAGAAEPPPALQLPADARPTHYALQLTIDPDRARFSGSAAIDVQLDKPRTVLWLHGQDLHVSAAGVRIAGAPEERIPASWEQVNAQGLVRLTLPRAVGPGAVQLQLDWDAAYDSRLVGLYLAREGGAAYAFTMFEPIDARRAFPGFDEPVFKTPFDVTLIVPAKDVAIGNTNVIDEAPFGNGDLKQVRFRTTAPLPTYLVAWAVGPFDVVTPPPLPPNEVRKTPLQVRGIAPRGRGGELAYALQAGGQLLETLERYFQIPFPYEKLDHVAVPDFAYGAEENAGEIHYRESILLFTPGRTAEDVKTHIASVMAHEMAHQWFGDLVTMRFWDDTWLNESFATWMGHRAVHSWDAKMLADLDLVDSIEGAKRVDSLLSSRAVRQPVTDLRNVWDQFNGITYQKGGAVLTMFERFLGAEPFRRGVSAYLSAHAYGSGSTDDLLQAISQAAGRDVVGPFHSFLDQPGLPLVKAKLVCDAGTPGAHVALAQSRYLPLGSAGDPARVWQLPVCVRYQVAAEEREACMLFAQAAGELALSRKQGEPCPAWVMPNANGAGYYRFELARADLKALRSAGYAHLDDREKMTVANDLGALTRSGALPESAALEAFEPLARDASGMVSAEPMEAYRFAHDTLVPEDERRAVEEYAGGLYRPALRRLGWKPAAGESIDARRQRAKVIAFLAFQARDPEVRREAARRGRAYIGQGGGALHPEAVDADLADAAVQSALEEGDAAFFDAVLARLRETQDLELRRRLLRALASARDPERSQRALLLSLDPSLRTTERFAVLARQAADPRTREAAFRFLEENFDKLVALLPGNQAARLPSLAAGFCDDEHLARAQAFFDGRAPRVPGMSRPLSEMLEEQRLCIAEVKAQRESAAAFFKPLARQRPLRLPASR